MKVKFYLYTLLLSIFFTSCDEYEGNTFDFSNSLPNYIEFKSVKALSVEPGARANFTIKTKSCFFKDVQVVVKIEGLGSNETKTVVLPKMENAVDESFVIPLTSTVGTEFTITIASAKTEGTEVRLGRVNSKSTIIKGKVVAPSKKE